MKNFIRQSLLILGTCCIIYSTSITYVLVSSGTVDEPLYSAEVAFTNSHDDHGDVIISQEQISFADEDATLFHVPVAEDKTNETEAEVFSAADDGGGLKMPMKMKMKMNISTTATATPTPTTTTISSSIQEEIKVSPLQTLIQETFAKLEKNNSSLALPIPPQPTMGAFIHVGKTGGQTLQQLLRNGCARLKKKPCKSYDTWPESNENRISKLTTYYHVTELKLHLRTDDAQSRYKFFVMTIRDPLERAISAFLYMHPTNVAYRALMNFRPKKRGEIINMAKHNMTEAVSIVENTYTNEQPAYMSQDHKDLYSCFHSLEEWAQKLVNITDYTWREWKDYHREGDCVNVAKSTLHHSQPWEALAHNYWDLRSIMWRIDDWTDRTILAIRTEFMWEDWISAHKWLGEEEGDIHIALKSKNSLSEGGNPIKDKTLSEGARKNLCLALRDEYRLYLKILVVSENLSQEDVSKSLDIARRHCGPWLDLKLPHVDEAIVFTTEGMAEERVWEF